MENLARYCATRYPLGMLSWRERYETALLAIAEACVTGEGEPLFAGHRAIQDANGKERHHHGVGIGSFGGYWHRGREGFEDDLLDGIAVGQVWAQLAPIHRETFEALLEVDGNCEEAARALGIVPSSYGPRLGRAQKAARKLWHDWEQPSRHYSTAGVAGFDRYRYAHRVAQRLKKKLAAA
jgi:hypothetical protein